MHYPTEHAPTHDGRVAGTTGGAVGESIGRAVQARVYRAGALGRRPAVPVLPRRLEQAAQRAMSRRAWAYVAGSAG